MLNSVPIFSISTTYPEYASTHLSTVLVLKVQNDAYEKNRSWWELVTSWMKINRQLTLSYKIKAHSE